jgi:hypothetical protein
MFFELVPVVYRYVKRTDSSDRRPRHVDVKVAGAAQKVELDGTMSRLGYEFADIVGSPPSEDRASFPSAALASSAGPEWRAVDPIDEDRPTPVEWRRTADLAMLEAAIDRVRESGGPPPDESFEPSWSRESERSKEPEREPHHGNGAAPIVEAVALARQGSVRPRVLRRARFGRRDAPLVLAAAPTTPLAQSALLTMALVGTFAVQAPVLQSDFKHDDFLHFYMGEAVPFGRFLMTPFAGHLMAVHRLCYFVLRAVFGLDAPRFFEIMLATHLVNVVLLYVLIRTLTARPTLAGFFAGLWGMAPVHTPTMNWFACYGQVQCVLFTLISLIGLARHAVEKRQPSWLTVVGWTFLLILGAASFGLGLVIALVFPILAWLLLEPDSKPRRTALRLVPLPVVVGILWWFSHTVTEGDVGPAKAAFRALGAMPRLIESFVQLSAYGVATLFVGPALTMTYRDRADWPFGVIHLDDVILLSYPFLVVVVLVVIVGYRRSDAVGRRHILAALLLYAASYGVVALTRGPLMFGLSFISTQSRYHYGETTAIALIVALALTPFEFRWASVGSRGPLLACLLLGLMIVPDGRATRGMDDGMAVGSRDVIVESEHELTAAVSGAPPGADVYLTNPTFTPLMLLFGFGVPRLLFPDLGAYFVVAHGPSGTIEGHHLRFVEKDPKLVAELRADDLPKVSRLFVTEDEALRAGAAVETVPTICFYPPGMAEVMSGKGFSAEARAQVDEALRHCKMTDRATDAIRRQIAADPAAEAKLRDELRASKDPKVLAQIAADLRRSKDPAVLREMSQAIIASTSASPPASATPPASSAAASP